MVVKDFLQILSAVASVPRFHEAFPMMLESLGSTRLSLHWRPLSVFGRCRGALCREQIPQVFMLLGGGGRRGEGGG